MSLAQQHRSRWPTTSVIYAGSAVLLAAGLLATDHHFHDEALPVVLFYGFMDVVLPLSLLGAAVYVDRTDLESREVWTASTWFVGGVVFVGVLYLWSRSTALLSGTVPPSLQADLALFANFGGGMGLVVGMNRARAKQSRRQEVRSTAQQETLEFINHLLRHNLLNGLQVIDGYAALLDDHVDEDGRGYLDGMTERTAHMADLVDDVRVLMRTLATDLETSAVDCSTVLDREVSVARSAYPSATFETDIEPGIRVEASEALGAAFENVLSNAVKHHDGERQHVHVAARDDGDGAASVRVADDGPGIPGRLKEVYVLEGERGANSSGDGLGLYLVATLVEVFDGDLLVEDNDPRGTVVEIRLPTSDA